MTQIKCNPIALVIGDFLASITEIHFDTQEKFFFECVYFDLYANILTISLISSFLKRLIMC